MRTKNIKMMYIHKYEMVSTVFTSYNGKKIKGTYYETYKGVERGERSDTRGAGICAWNFTAEGK